MNVSEWERERERAYRCCSELIHVYYIYIYIWKCPM